MFVLITSSGGIVGSRFRKLWGTVVNPKRYRRMYTMSVAVSTVPFMSTSYEGRAASMFALIVASDGIVGSSTRKLGGTVVNPVRSRWM